MMYELDIADGYSLTSDEDHIKFVDKCVSEMLERGFDAQVSEYFGPGGGAGVIRFGPGTRTFNELNEFLEDWYGPDWLELQ